MVNFYVNINNDYTTNGLGTNSNPFNYTQFLSNISSGLQNDTTYYVEGLRTLSADEDVDIYVNSSINSDVHVSITNKLNEPWVITAYDSTSGSNVITISTGNILDNIDYMTPKSLTIQNGVIAIYNSIVDIGDLLIFNNIDGRLDTSLNIDNTHIEVVQ